ncbi:MAG TPA: S41 family peptidase, partial [Thermoanaerobaculia bacterium]
MLLLAAATAFAQLTQDQKIADFQNVVAIYDKNYGPYEWKRDVIGFDLLNTTPWLDKIRATTNDLDFYEVMVSYIASLNDAHDTYSVPSSFLASLGFGADIYDGKLLVDTISRSALPASKFPFQIGYELVSIDGTDAQQLLNSMLQYGIAANPRSTARISATWLTLRPQSVLPHATNVPDSSAVVFRRPDGGLETYQIAWTKSGLPLTNVGRYITPSSLHGPTDYTKTLEKLWNCRIPDRAVLSFGSQAPIFVRSMPPGFLLRHGGSSADIFYSGTFQSGGFTIGYIRIPNFAPSNQATALNLFRSDIAFFEQNTDGLIVDVMRNPGGSVGYLNQILASLMPSQWRSIAFDVRATSTWIEEISAALESAKS